MTQPMPTLPGMPEQIARYQLLSELGRGSMGHVYLALDPNIDRKVALKIFLPLLKVGAAEQWELRQRFVFEARAAGQLSHPGIVTIFDADTDADTGLSYLAMEWVNGPSLDDLIRESAPLSVERSMTIAEEVAEALDVAHRQGLVHRDIKPANILLESDGRAKVTDFGIAKLASMSITATGWIPGSPFYMSPEQVRNENIDRRSDIYALGAVLYQCLTGRLPFEAESLAALTHMILEIDPRPVRSINPAVSAELAAVIESALAKSPDQRFDSGREFARALQLARVGRFPGVGGSVKPVAVPPEGLEDGPIASPGTAAGTGTVGLTAPAGEAPLGETPAGEAPDVDASGAREPADDGNEVAEEAEPEPPETKPRTLIVEPEAPVRPRPRPGPARPDEVRILNSEPPVESRAGTGRLLLAAGVILALALVAWGLRPVASEPADGASPLARLLLPAPRFSPAAPPDGTQVELPSEPAEPALLEDSAEPLEDPALSSTPPVTPQAVPSGSGPSPALTRRARPPVRPAAGPATKPAVAIGGSASAAPNRPPAASPELVAPAASSLPPPAPRARATSKLEIVYRNRLANATLSVSIDDERVYAGNVEMGGGGFFGKALGKNVWTALSLTPGEHVVDIRITGGEGKVDLVRQTTAFFEDGQTHRLRVSVTPFKKLKLTWKDSPGG